jgi:hypothetical protein
MAAGRPFHCGFASITRAPLSFALGILMSKKPSHEYYERIKALDSVVNECIAVSQQFAGIKSPTGAHYYASVLFTSLCSRGVTLAIMAPYSPWAKKKIEHWDYASMAGVVRSILEVRLAFYYLCAEQVSPEEWNCRWNIFNLHDCSSRIHLFTEMPDSEENIKGFEEQAEELRQRLQANTYFKLLPEKQQKQLLHGKTAYLYPLEQIGVGAGVDLHTFRWLYKLLSSQVHGLPMSFYRNGEQNRGRGVHSESEEGFTSLCISFAVSLLVGARDEMKEIFSGAKNA